MSRNELLRLTGVSIKTIDRWLASEQHYYKPETVRKIMILQFDTPARERNVGNSYRKQDIQRVYNALDKAVAAGMDDKHIAFVSGIGVYAVRKLLRTPREGKKCVGIQTVRGAAILERHLARGRRRERAVDKIRRANDVAGENGDGGEGA